MAAPCDRGGRAPQAAVCRRKTAAALATHARRHARALPAARLPRPEALLDRGRRHHSADARHGARARRRVRRAQDRDGHGAPRPAQCARPRREPALRSDPRRVRGRRRQFRDRSRGRHRRREVPPWRRGHVQDGEGPRGARRAAREPEPPRSGEPRRRGMDAGGADRSLWSGAEVRRVHGPAAPDPRRCRVRGPGRRGRDVQPGAAARLHNRRHHPSDHQQPDRFHHRSRQRRRSRGVHRRGPPRVDVSREVPRRRRDRRRGLPALGPQRGRRASVHAARDVRSDQEDAAGAREIRGAARGRRSGHAGSGAGRGGRGLRETDRSAAGAEGQAVPLIG